MSPESKAYLWLISCVAAGALMVVLALNFGLYLLYGLAGIVGLAALRFGIMPIVRSGAETASLIIEARQKVLETRIMREEHERRMKTLPPDVYMARPDPYGNYEQPIGIDGRLRAYLPPGNPGESVNASNFNQFQEIIEGQANILPDEDEQLLLEGPDDDIDAETVEAPTFAEDLEDGYMEPGQDFTFAYAVVTDPYRGVTELEPITDAHKNSLFLAGWTGMGKSTLIACAMARRARTERKVAFLVFDPHKGAEEDSLAVQILPTFEDWLIQPKGGEKVTGKRPVEVRASVQFLKNEVELRLRRPDLTPEQKRQISPYYDLSIWVIIDECLSYARETRLARHDPVYDELMALMQEIATDGRKVHITGVYMTQLSTKDELGDFEIKDACPKRVVLSVPRDQGKALGLTGPEAAKAERFPQGRGYYKTKSGMQVFVWGYGSPADIARALEGIPSPLIPEWKQTGKNVIDLASRVENRGQVPSDFTPGNMAEIGWKPDSGNQYPPALQAALEAIPDWEKKLDTLRTMIGGDLSEIWVALFGKAPGGRNHNTLKREYDVLAEAIRYEYQQLRLLREAGGA